jgi:large subunit ribosomal protein L3
MRTALIAKKLGMTRMFDETGEQLTVTVLHVDNCEVIRNYTVNGGAKIKVEIGAGEAKTKNTTKSLRGHFGKNNVTPKRIVKSFTVSKECVLESGTKLSCEHFVNGQFVDAIAISKGKGFAGAMKRHNFRGLEASHGVSISHRSHGSTGQRQDPGKVFKGKKMAGHLGDVRVTTQNLQVIKVDTENQLVFLKGNVPGSNGTYVQLKDAVKRALPASAPLPAGIIN